jgi:RNA polymerase sigma-70 factor (ECF subfamily)
MLQLFIGGTPIMKDQELIKRIRSGDKEAFSLLVKDHLPAAYKTAYLILRSKEHAEDAMQNALEGVYISIIKHKEITNFKAWFYSIVYSRSIDLYRKNNRYLHTDLDDSKEAQMKMKMESAQQEAIHKENKNEMITHILNLKREQSVPIFLYYFEDMTIKDISLILDENVNTIKTRMKRGRQELVSLIKKSNYFLQEVKTNGI